MFTAFNRFSIVIKWLISRQSTFFILEFPDYGTAIVSFMNIVMITVTHVIINAMWLLLTFTHYSSINTVCQK